MDIILRGDSGAHITVIVKGYEHPDAKDVDGRNWLSGYVTCRVGAYSASTAVSVTTRDLTKWQERTAGLLDSSVYATDLTMIEEWLELTLRRETSGTIRVDGIVRSSENIGLLMVFNFNTDSDAISRFQASIDDVLKAFPAR